jgi:hypothetical protein
MIEKYFTSTQIKDFCKKAGLKCTGTKSELIEEIKTYLGKYKVAPRYLRSLSPGEKLVKKFEIRYNTLKERAGSPKTYKESVLDKKYRFGSALVSYKFGTPTFGSAMVSYEFGRPVKKSKKKSVKKSKKKSVKKSRKPRSNKKSTIRRKKTVVKSRKPKKISKYTEKWNKKYKTTSLEGKSKRSGVPKSILQKVYNKGLAAWRGSAHRPGASQQSWAVARVNSFLTCGKTFYFPDHLLAKQAMKQSPKAKAFFKKQGCKFNKMGKRTPSK